MIKIGSDPEFIMANHNGLVSAGEYLSFKADFGTDGNSSVAELRPYPAKDSLELTANIRQLIRNGIEQIREIKDLSFLSGHFKHDQPIGGHIHLSGYQCDNGDVFRNLDIVLGTLSDCIDDLWEREKRWQTGYGKGWRTSRHHYGIEYRAPGSWLVTPHVAFLNLWLAEATVYATENDQFFAFDILQEIGGCQGIIAFGQQVQGIGNKEIFLKVAEQIFSTLPINWDVDFKEAWL